MTSIRPLRSPPPAPPLPPPHQLEQRLADPLFKCRRRCGEVGGGATSRAFQLFLSARVAVFVWRPADAARRFDTAGLDVNSPLRDPAAANAASILLSLHLSHSLPPSISDLLRCGHDRWRCRCVAPCLCLLTSWLLAGVNVTDGLAS